MLYTVSYIPQTARVVVTQLDEPHESRTFPIEDLRTADPNIVLDPLKKRAIEFVADNGHMF